MTREEIMGNEPKIQASFEVIGDDVKFIKLIVNGKEKVVSIEELEKTLPEPCEDCISRQAVLDEMNIRRDNGDMITAGFIKGLPPVTPKSKKGRWLNWAWDEDKYRYVGWLCSNCKRIKSNIGMKTDYCPACGIEMVNSQWGGNEK